MFQVFRAPVLKLNIEFVTQFPTFSFMMPQEQTKVKGMTVSIIRYCGGGAKRLAEADFCVVPRCTNLKYSEKVRQQKT